MKEEEGKGRKRTKEGVKIRRRYEEVHIMWVYITAPILQLDGQGGGNK